MNKKEMFTFVEKEVKEDILTYWLKTVDLENGGFFGMVTNNGTIIKDAPKGLVLNARLLWTYSIGYKMFKNPEYLKMADHAYSFLVNNFYDKEHKGFYWMLDNLGTPTIEKKQVYGIAFGIYGLAEYYGITQKGEALDLAVETFEILEKYTLDNEKEGYVEARSRDWSVIDDMQLLTHDVPSIKTMNTHLHLLEAYTNLYRYYKSEAMARSLRSVIKTVIDHIIDPKTFHFVLYFDENWVSQANIDSYGHDIEGSWLLYEAALVLGDKALIKICEDISVKMAKAVYEDGLESDGSILNEVKDGEVEDSGRVWWVEAEAVVGFLNAYELTLDNKYLKASEEALMYIDKFLIDKTYGEWYRKVKEDGTPYTDFPKVDPWKCPYHNTRMCMEVIERIKKLSNKL